MNILNSWWILETYEINCSKYLQLGLEYIVAKGNPRVITIGTRTSIAKQCGCEVHHMTTLLRSVVGYPDAASRLLGVTGGTMEHR